MVEPLPPTLALIGADQAESRHERRSVTDRTRERNPMGVAQSPGGLRWSESGEVALAYHRLHEMLLRKEVTSREITESVFAAMAGGVVAGLTGA